MSVKKSALLTAIFTSVIALTNTAHAATCADRSQVVAALDARFGEALYGNAVSNDGNVLEVYSNSASETWTILVTLPDRGLACHVASGTGVQQMEMHLAGLDG